MQTIKEEKNRFKRTSYYDKFVNKYFEIDNRHFFRTRCFLVGRNGRTVFMGKLFHFEMMRGFAIEVIDNPDHYEFFEDIKDLNTYSLFGDVEEIYLEKRNNRNKR